MSVHGVDTGGKGNPQAVVLGRFHYDGVVPVETAHPAIVSCAVERDADTRVEADGDFVEGGIDDFAPALGKVIDAVSYGYVFVV